MSNDLIALYCIGGGTLFNSIGIILFLRRVSGVLAIIRRDQAEQRRAIGGLVEQTQTLRNRLTQVETQLGRTMRHAGVPGLG